MWSTLLCLVHVVAVVENPCITTPQKLFRADLHEQLKCSANRVKPGNASMLWYFTDTPDVRYHGETESAQNQGVYYLGFMQYWMLSTKVVYQEVSQALSGHNNWPGDILVLIITTWSFDLIWNCLFILGYIAQKVHKSSLSKSCEVCDCSVSVADCIATYYSITMSHQAIIYRLGTGAAWTQLS